MLEKKKKAGSRLVTELQSILLLEAYLNKADKIISTTTTTVIGWWKTFANNTCLKRSSVRKTDGRWWRFGFGKNPLFWHRTATSYSFCYLYCFGWWEQLLRQKQLRTPLLLFCDSTFWVELSAKQNRCLLQFTGNAMFLANCYGEWWLKKVRKQHSWS